MVHLDYCTVIVDLSSENVCFVGSLTQCFTFVSVAVRVVQGRQWVLSTSCSTLPESLVEDRMCRYNIGDCVWGAHAASYLRLLDLSCNKHCNLIGPKTHRTLVNLHRMLVKIACLETSNWVSLGTTTCSQYFLTLLLGSKYVRLWLLHVHISFHTSPQALHRTWVPLVFWKLC